MKKTTIATLGLLGLGLTLGLGTKAQASEITENGQIYWQVESGDTLSEIGNRYGLGYNAIQQANADIVADANLIFVGDKLLLPLNGEAQVVVEETQPVEEQTVVEETQPVEESQPVVEETQPVVEEQPVAQAPASSSSAKEWIAQKESGGSYTAQNGRLAK